MGRPRLILVTGPAGSGKTSLAYALGRAIGCPVVSRDAIKEGMVVAEPGFAATTGDHLTARAYEVFFATLALMLRAEVTVVAEAAFGPSVGSLASRRSAIWPTSGWFAVR